MRYRYRKIPFSPLWLIFLLLFRNGGISFSRIPNLIVYLIRFILLEPLRLLELLLYDQKIRSHQLNHPPIFILGHWRSGTSYLQGLICLNQDVASSTIYRSLFADTFYLTESWLMPTLNLFCKLFKIPYSLQRSQLDLSLPAESDMALCSLTSTNSYTWGQLFPKKFSKWAKKLLLLPDNEVAKNWILDYDYYIKKISLISNNKTVVVKSPGDTARMVELHKKYPTAKFIFIHRNPIDVYHSNIYFWNTILRQNSLQTISKQNLRYLIIETYKLVMLKYLNDKKHIPKSQFIELSYADLLINPRKKLNFLFDFLEIEPLQLRDNYLLKNSRHKPASYSTNIELKDLLAKEWGFAFIEWHYKI